MLFILIYSLISMVGKQFSWQRENTGGRIPPMKPIIWTKEMIPTELTNSMICFNVTLLIVNLTRNEMLGTPSGHTKRARQRRLDNPDKKWHFFSGVFVVWYQLLELTGPLIKAHVQPASCKDRLPQLSVHYRRNNSWEPPSRAHLSTKQRQCRWRLCRHRISKWNFRTKKKKKKTGDESGE